MEYLLKTSIFASSLINFLNFKSYTVNLNEVQLLAECSIQPIDLSTKNRRLRDAVDRYKQRQLNAESFIEAIDLSTKNRGLFAGLNLDEYQLNEV